MTSSLQPGQRIAVTGANGFIGAHCVVSLLQAGFQVVAIVRDPNNVEKTQFLKEHAIAKLGNDIADKNLSFAAGDLLEEGSYDDAFSNCQGILHTAAVVEISNVKDPQGQIVRPSVQGTKNVLQSIQKHKNSIQRYVHLSSVAAIQSLEQPEDHVFDDSDWNTWSTVENDPYGYAKAEAEKLIWQDKNGFVETVALNPAVVLGPCLCKAHTKSSTVFLRQIIYGNPMLNYNCSFVDVRDVAKAAVKAFQAPQEQVAGKRFILCGTQAMSTIALNDHVKKVHPWVAGASPQYPPALLNWLIWVGQIPFLKQWGVNDFQRQMLQRLIQFDATLSKDVLGVAYTPLGNTCRDTVDSMKPFVKIQDWGGIEEDDSKNPESKL